MLAVRSRALSRDPEESLAVDATWDDGESIPDVEEDRPTLGRMGELAGIIAVGGAVATIAVGFAGGDVATVLTMVAAAITALALVDGRLSPDGIRRAISVPAVAVILGAAVLREPIAGLAAYLPVPDAATPAWLALPAVALVGGGLLARQQPAGRGVRGVLGCMAPTARRSSPTSSGPTCWPSRHRTDRSRRCWVARWPIAAAS